MITYQRSRVAAWILFGIAGGFLFSLNVSAVAEDGNATLRVGVAEVEITPPEKYPISGYYHERLATGTIDPLKARALVFAAGDERAAVVCCDLTGIATDLATEVRRRVASKAGIPANQIMLTASHSHTAPDYFKDLYLYLNKPEAQRDQASYVHTLIDRICQAIERASESARPARVAAGSALQETPVSFNRRFVMKDGSVRTWMSLENPDVVRPAGPIDPEVGLLAVYDQATNKPLAVLSNFALHLDTVGGTRWSADYPFFIEQAVRGKLGPEVVSLFGTGCCGDINHVDPARRERNKTDLIGTSLGATVRDGLGQLKAVERPQLVVRTGVVRAPLQDVSDADVASARPVLSDARSGKTVDFLTQVASYKHLMVDQLRHRRSADDASNLLGWGLSHTWGGIGAELPLEVTTLAFGGDVAIVFLPGEIFVDLGLAIKRGSPFRTTLVIELSNCVETVYVPTRAAFAGGSYEVTNAALRPGSGEMLVEEALRQLRAAASQMQAK